MLNILQHDDRIQGSQVIFAPTNESAALLASPATSHKPSCVCICHEPSFERQTLTKMDQQLQAQQMAQQQMAAEQQGTLPAGYQLNRQPMATIGADGLAMPITMPTRIPENPTTKELFELMTNTQALLMGFQQSTDLRLRSLETKASTNIDKLDEISRSVESNKTNIDLSTAKIGGLEGSTREIKTDLGNALERIAELEKGLNQLDRNVRSYNLRFLQVREDANENCILKVATAIKNNSYCTRNPHLSLDEVMKGIEGAHRLGKDKVGQHRPILVRFYAKNLRDDVVQACKKKGGKTAEGYSITDDRTMPDTVIHARNLPYMQQWYDLDGTKIFYKH